MSGVSHLFSSIQRRFRKSAMNWKSGMPKLRGGFIDAAADGVSVAGSAAPLLEPTPRVQ